MSKKTPIFVELGLGLLLTGLVAFSYHKRTTVVETASLKTYDVFSKFRPPAKNSDSIRIVEIDDNALASLGRWPWPRPIVAQLVDEVVNAGGKVMGLNILFLEPDQNASLEEVSNLYAKFEGLLKTQRGTLSKNKVTLNAFRSFLQDDLANAQNQLDGDTILAQSIEQAVNVVLPMYFLPGEALGNNLEPLPAFFDKEKVSLPKSAAGLPAIPPGKAAVLPIDLFGKGALAIGHSNLTPDMDGALRRITPVMRYGDAYFPSFGIELVREYLQLQRNALTWKAPGGLSLAKANIPLDKDARVFIELAGPSGTFPRFSAVDVLSGGLPEKALKDKIVLIGLTATGLGETFVGPGGERFTGLEIWANHIENILNQRFISRPPWADQAEWGMIALAALVLLGVLPFLRAKVSIPAAGLAFLGMIGASGFLFVKQGLWVSPAYGAALLVFGFAVLVGKRLVFTEKGKELVEAEGVETNKMLGLSFQGQGMLDLAFEKFRRCPIDSPMKDLLYNLGLDMERKRQFSKAAAVYEHLATNDPKYKDIREKIELLKKAGEGAVFGAIGKKGSDATVVVEGLGQNTTLGRYEVMKELGRGAMGIVYLGKDPKINRAVAIKTLRFEEAVDDEQAKSIKERFFREAESAGNLTHPNIIRIFDAGEDQDVAYIAMELLEGDDLKRFCDKAHLLPFEQVLDLVIHVASGLDYAHKQGVVHRDIKPGNIMLLKDGTLRITDFGIARIQATSKTATGAVLGTPAYMSPEQVNGKKVDGRADIFSLAVTLFELLTGEKPFHADSIAALLYRIANVDHPDPREFNPKLSPAVVPILKKALAKNPDERYQTAGEFGNDLKAVLEKRKSTPMPAVAIPPPPPPAAPDPVIIEFPTSVEAEGKLAEPPAPGPAPITEAPDSPQPVIEQNSEIDMHFEALGPEMNHVDSPKMEFLTELEETFDIPGKEEPKLMGDTLVVPPSPDIEKTVVVEPKPPVKDTPVSSEIEPPPF